MMMTIWTNSSSATKRHKERKKIRTKEELINSKAVLMDSFRRPTSSSSVEFKSKVWEKHFCVVFWQVDSDRFVSNHSDYFCFLWKLLLAPLPVPFYFRCTENIWPDSFNNFKVVVSESSPIQLFSWNKCKISQLFGKTVAEFCFRLSQEHQSFFPPAQLPLQLCSLSLSFDFTNKNRKYNQFLQQKSECICIAWCQRCNKDFNFESYSRELL